MAAQHSRFHAIGPRLPLIITVVAALTATLGIGAAIGQGEFTRIYILFFGIAGAITVLSMGSKYWMLIPVSFSFDLPAIPFYHGRAFELPELVIILCTVVFACRYALNPRGVTVFRKQHAGIILYSAW